LPAWSSVIARDGRAGFPEWKVDELDHVPADEVVDLSTPDGPSVMADMLIRDVPDDVVAAL
jgi:hypothetical protein